MKNEEKRESEKERYKCEEEKVNKDKQMIINTTNKQVGVMGETTIQTVRAIEYKGKLEAEEIKAETLDLSTHIVAQGSTLYIYIYIYMHRGGGFAD